MKKLQVAVKTWVYRPDRAWKKNVMSDCLFDSRDRRYEERAVRIDKQERRFGMKDYQMEVRY